MRTLTLVTEQLLAPVPGGTARYASQIGPALAATSPDGWKVRSVTAFHRNVEPAELRGVDGPSRLPVGARALAALWQWGLPPWPLGSVVHALTPLTPSGRFYRRKKLVVTVHDTVPWTHPETLTVRGVNWHKRMIAISVADAVAIVVPTQAVATELASIFPAAAGKIEVVHMGVTNMADDLTVAASRARRNELGLPEEYVLVIATLEPRKGLDILIRAMADSEVKAGRTHLVVVGQQGWGDISLAATAASDGMSLDRLHLLGRLSDVDLAAVLTGATVLAAPSRSEGFGLPVLEAFAAGVPVVCSDAPAFVEVAGDAALVTPREDDGELSKAITRVLGDPGLRKSMRAAGSARAREFSWVRAAERLWSIYLGAGMDS